ncbi:hypothetical protein [Oceanicella actignis]|uniref:Uncharacterized protein n=1 Tax=Oceanicella actignis TaxID=1189325 RepID=A0A1M7TSL2_9RHOB|nr:hypothetical protein [Oceanicella actignis]SET76401.1 hypothetical protein SAMN04488119_10929 [Oceanicella actignis]SHN73739.1 hypothetical protein SAMN05216200_10993 [Oceanicella actignis]
MFRISFGAIAVALALVASTAGRAAVLTAEAAAWGAPHAAPWVGPWSAPWIGPRIDPWIESRVEERWTDAWIAQRARHALPWTEWTPRSAQEMSRRLAPESPALGYLALSRLCAARAPERTDQAWRAGDGLFFALAPEDPELTRAEAPAPRLAAHDAGAWRDLPLQPAAEPLPASLGLRPACGSWEVLIAFARPAPGGWLAGPGWAAAGWIDGPPGAIVIASGGGGGGGSSGGGNTPESPLGETVEPQEPIPPIVIGRDPAPLPAPLPAPAALLAAALAALWGMRRARPAR